MEKTREREREKKAMLAVKSETYTKSEIAADHPQIGDPGIKTWARAAQIVPVYACWGIHQTTFD